MTLLSFPYQLLLKILRKLHFSHLWWAELLLKNLQPIDNRYSLKDPKITWKHFDGSDKYSNHTACNSFIALLLRHAYNLSETQMKNWFGAKSPSPGLFLETIEAQKGFAHIKKIHEIKSGDVIAVRYPESEEATGHVMLVRNFGGIFVDENRYTFEVIDSTRYPHGREDSRRVADTTEQGAGFGSIYLYADSDYNIVGHTWSTLKGSEFRDISSYPLAVGRVDKKWVRKL